MLRAAFDTGLSLVRPVVMPPIDRKREVCVASLFKVECAASETDAASAMTQKSRAPSFPYVVILFAATSIVALKILRLFSGM